MIFIYLIIILDQEILASYLVFNIKYQTLKPSLNKILEANPIDHNHLTISKAQQAILDFSTFESVIHQRD